MNAADRPEAVQHSAADYSFGRISTLEASEDVQVRRLDVAPGKSVDQPDGIEGGLHWLMVKGTADCRIGDERLRLETGESTDLRPKTPYTLANMTSEPLTIIEIMSPPTTG